MALCWSLSKQANIYLNHKNYIVILSSDVKTKENEKHIKVSSKFSWSENRKNQFLFLLRIVSLLPSLSGWNFGGDRGSSCVQYSRIHLGRHFKRHIVKLPYGRVGPLLDQIPWGQLPLLANVLFTFHLYLPQVPRTWLIFTPSGYNHLPFHLGSLHLRPSLALT